MMNTSIDQVPALVQKLYAIVKELESLFPGRKFTPDGHLVGSIGEVIAAHRYGLSLHDASMPTHDAITKDGRHVQVKATQATQATQATSVALRSEPEHIIVLKLGPTGHATEVYNGPGQIAWKHCGVMQKNGQRPISLSKLRALMVSVPETQRLPIVNE